MKRDLVGWTQPGSRWREEALVLRCSEAAVSGTHSECEGLAGLLPCGTSLLLGLRQQFHMSQVFMSTVWRTYKIGAVRLKM